MAALRFGFTLMLFFAAYDIDGIDCFCRPRFDPPRKETKQMILGHILYDIDCHIDTLCDNTNTIVFYHCDIHGNNCTIAYSYSFGNHSELTFGDTRLWRRYNQYRLELYFTRAEIRDDGIWQCFIHAGDEVYGGTTTNVTVTVRNKKEDIRIWPLELRPRAYQKFYLFCEIDKIRPAWELVWVINGVDYHGVQRNTPNNDTEDTWKVHNTLEVVLAPMIHPVEALCAVGEMRAYRWARSDSFILNPREAKTQYKFPTVDVKIGCLTPLAYPFIGWRHNEVLIQPNSIFNETHSEVQGIFDFRNETTAQFSQLEWTLPSQDWGCNGLDWFTGTYDCVAGHNNHGFSYVSPPSRVIVEYHPMLDFNSTGSNVSLLVPFTANVQLVCACCASPPIDKYKWWKAGANDVLADRLELLDKYRRWEAQDTDLLIGTSRAHVLPHATTNDFGLYICEAMGKYRAEYFLINLHRKVINSNTHNYQANMNESVTMRCPICDGSEDKCTWKFGNEEVCLEQNYVIDVLRVEHYGKYTCTAVHAFGRIWMSITLETSPPTGSVRDNLSTTRIIPDITNESYSLSAVIAGLTVFSGVVLALLIAVFALCCILIRRKSQLTDRTPKKTFLENGKISMKN